MSEFLGKNTNHTRGKTQEGFPGQAKIRDGTEKPVILVVTRYSNVTETAMDYAFDVAERLNHRLLIAYVNPLPFLWDGGHQGGNFNVSVNRNVATIKKMARSREVTVSCIKDTGKVSRVVSRLCRILKRIEFILIDKDIKSEEIASRSPVPVFCVSKPEKLEHKLAGVGKLEPLKHDGVAKSSIYRVVGFL